MGVEAHDRVHRQDGHSNIAAALRRVQPDHVHLLVHYPAKVQLPNPVDSLEGVFARLLRKEYDAHVRRYLWADTSGPAPASPEAAAGHP
ncbi:transposase [Streptomyces sp. NPDC059680]|uniref:transposase n=1 Tax=Streptomyces sp. NPDC059680 TaxID=3346904 RepID=UPI00368B0C82